MSLQQVTVGLHRIRRATVSVMNKAGSGPPVENGHLQAGLDQRPVVGGRHGPAHHLARTQVQKHGQVQPTVACFDESDIPGPDLIGPAGRKHAVQPVRGHPVAVLGAGRRHKTTSAPRINTVGSAQSRHPVPATDNAFPVQLLPGFHEPVVLMRLVMDTADMTQQAPIFPASLTLRTSLPGIITRATDPQDAASHRDRRMKAFSPTACGSIWCGSACLLVPCR